MQRPRKRAGAKVKPKGRGARGTKPPRAGDSVDALLAARKHPLQKDIDVLRGIVRSASPAIRERWKWNAPSFYADAKGEFSAKDVPMERNLCNVNLFKEDFVMLVFVFFHGIPDEAPEWLQGKWKDRRVATFAGSAEIRSRAKELQGLLREMVGRAGAHVLGGAAGTSRRAEGP